MKKLLIAAVATVLAAGAAQAAVSAGDIAVVAYRSDDADAFAWVALTDLAAGTTLSFTDSSWQSTAFRSGENGVISWTSTTAVSAGSVVKWQAGTSTWNDGSVATVTNPGVLSMSAAGDQVFVFTGTFASPALVYGLQFANPNGIVTAGPSASTNTTNVPDGLSLAARTMVDVGNFDNGYYGGPTAGTRLELLQAIADPTNWVVSNDNLDTSTAWASSFTVATIPEPSTYALLLGGLTTVWLRARRRQR